MFADSKYPSRRNDERMGEALAKQRGPRGRNRCAAAKRRRMEPQGDRTGRHQGRQARQVLPQSRRPVAGRPYGDPTRIMITKHNPAGGESHGADKSIGRSSSSIIPRPAAGDPWQVMPPLTADEYAGLKADIQ